MKKLIAIIGCITLLQWQGLAQTALRVKVPAMPDTAARTVLLQRQLAALQQSTPGMAVRDCFLFLLDGLDSRFLKNEQVEHVLDLIQSRIITDSTATSFGNIFWGWNEQGSDAGDGNNVQFCVQYGIPIKLLFNDRLSVTAKQKLDKIFDLATNGVRQQVVRISYTNIYLMKIWNLVALGQVYQQPALVEEGRRLFDTWLDHVARYGNREYDSPTYSGVDLESLLLLKRFATDAGIKKKTDDALNFLLTDLCAHYNQRGGFLGGAHSRDYNRVFGRDLLEEKYFNPLLGRKNNNTQLFNQLCLATLQEMGLTPQQKELMNRPNRWIVQRWDSFPNAYACDYVGNKVSIASSNQSYSPDDKAFAVYLSSPRIPEMLNITYLMEGRDDHYGTWNADGMGEKMKHRMPANYPSNGGWNKTRHLMYFMQSAQNKGEFVMVAAGTKDHNSINNYLNSTIILPNTFDEIWIGNQRVGVPVIGANTPLDQRNTVIARFEDVAIAIRVLWNDAGKAATMRLHNDGFTYRPNRENFQLTNNAGLRLTMQHPPNGKGAIALWWKVAEGIKTSADFTRFRQSVLQAQVTVKEAGGIVDLGVTTASGKLGVKADLANKLRLAYYNPTPLPMDFLFNVDGVEIGRPIMAKYKQSTVLLDNFYNKELHPKTGLPFHYLWTDTAMSGYAQLGAIFTNRGARLSTLPTTPSREKLKEAAVYIIVDPDTKLESPQPNYMKERDAAAIADWVKEGGVLLLMANDNKNAELDSFNILAAKFGMEFNKDQLHPVTGQQWEMGASVKLPDHPLFKGVNKIYLKEVASIRCSGKARPVLTENGKVLMASANFGKGYVLAVGDPWIYNEYIDHWLLPESFDNLKAANNLVDLLLGKAKKN